MPNYQTLVISTSNSHVINENIENFWYYVLGLARLHTSGVSQIDYAFQPPAVIVTALNNLCFLGESRDVDINSHGEAVWICVGFPHPTLRITTGFNTFN